MEDSKKLYELLDDLEDYIENKMRGDFETSELYPIFKDLVYIEWKNVLDKQIIQELSILTDDMDCFNFHDVKGEIQKLRGMLENIDD